MPHSAHSAASPTPHRSDWIAVASLLRPQGRRGELLAEPLTDSPDLLAPGRVLHLAAAGASQPSPDAPLQTVIGLWHPTGRNAGRIVLQLEGCDSITAAEQLAGRQLLLPADQLPALAADTYYVTDLIGCQLLDSALPVGRVLDIEFSMAPDGRTRLPDAPPLLVVQTSAAEPVLVPFVRAWQPVVDLAARTISMSLPPGLIAELAADSDLTAPTE